jgi:hypothetical protein
MSASRILFAVLVLTMTPLPGRAAGPYKTENVFLLVMDGVRYVETFGDPKHELIPHMWNDLRPLGTVFTEHWISDEGVTVTRPGHSTMISGTWQTVPNGSARLTMPTLFDYYRSETKRPATDCWAIFGKGDYAFAPYSSMPAYLDKYEPMFVAGLGENGPEGDDKVCQKILDVMATDKPHIVFANFGWTDHAGHTGVEEDYRSAVKHCDELFWKIWQAIQSDPHYKDRTTLILTNDHGRHTKDFTSHGDKCEGCQHIMLLVVGPDTPSGKSVSRRVELVDLAPTIGELLGIQTPLAMGSTIPEVFTKLRGINQNKPTTEEATQALKQVSLASRPLAKVVAEHARSEWEPKEVALNRETLLLLHGLLASGEDWAVEYVKKWLERDFDQLGPNAKAVYGSALLLLGDATKDASYTDKAVEIAEGIGASEAPRMGDVMLGSFVFRAGAAGGNRKLMEQGVRMATGGLARRVGMKVKDPVEDSWLLYWLTAAHTTHPGNEEMRKAALTMLARVLGDQSEVGGLWSKPDQSALNLACMTMMMGRGARSLASFQRTAQGSKTRPTPLDDLTAAEITWVLGREVGGDRASAGLNAVRTRVWRAKQAYLYSMQCLRYLPDERGCVGPEDSRAACGAFLLCEAQSRGE